MNKTDLILDAALKLFVEHGFHGTATSKIAQEAGIANGTLFQYFKTKDELVIALYIHIKDELANFIAKNTVQKDDIKETIKSQVLASLYWAVDSQVKFNFIQQIHASPYLGQIAQDVLNKQVEPHLQVIEKGIQQGVLKPLPVDLIYALMSSQIFGVYQFITSNKLSKAKQKEIIQMTFEMLWKMIT